MNLAPYTHPPRPNEGPADTELPFQTQYQLIKNEYVWRGTGNITDAVLRQSCPDTRTGADIYYADSYVGGVFESGTATSILNWENELIYTLSNLTLYDKGGQTVGTVNWEEEGLLVLTNPNDELVAQWGFEPTRLEVYAPLEVNRALLFAVASKFAFGAFNDCTTQYWMSLQIVLISGILSLGSIVAMSIMVYKRREFSPRKNLRLQTFTKDEW